MKVLQELCILWSGGKPMIEPTKVLEQSYLRNVKEQGVQWLVQWTNIDLREATLEREEEILKNSHLSSFRYSLLSHTT